MGHDSHAQNCRTRRVRIPPLQPARRVRKSGSPNLRRRGAMADRTAEPLLPVELGSGKVRFARGIKAGRWVFATGLMAQDFVHGIAPDVLAERMPHGGRPK